MVSIVLAPYVLSNQGTLSVSKSIFQPIGTKKTNKFQIKKAPVTKLVSYLSDVEFNFKKIDKSFSKQN